MRTKNLFTFDSSRDRAWSSVNDDVMGGVSKGRMVFDPRTQTAKFAGTLSLRNNGGFSTVRSRSRDLGLRGYDGLIVRVRGDGRTYRVQALVGDSRWRMGIYQKEIDTVAGEWQEIRVPFAEMTYRVRGRRIPRAPVEGSQVRSIGFSIADKNEKPFELEIDWIRGYRAVKADSATAGIRGNQP